MQIWNKEEKKNAKGSSTHRKQKNHERKTYLLLLRNPSQRIRQRRPNPSTHRNWLNNGLNRIPGITSIRPSSLLVVLILLLLLLIPTIPLLSIRSIRTNTNRVGAAVAGMICCIAPVPPPCIVKEVWTDAGRGMGVEEGGVAVVVVAFCCMFVGSNSANVFYLSN